MRSDEKSKGSLERVSFNFLNSCNMRCAFCYLPFDGLESDISHWKRVLRRLVELGTHSITFGGGDPFKYPDFMDVLRFVRTDLPEISFVTLDTNGIGLRRELFRELPSLVDVLGLPVDGFTEKTHGSMRSSKAHLARVLHLVDALHERMPLKINTVISRRNIGEIGDIGQLLSNFKISWWSLYEFWALGDAALDNEDDFSLPRDAFRNVSDAIMGRFPLPILKRRRCRIAGKATSSQVRPAVHTLSMAWILAHM